MATDHYPKYYYFGGTFFSLFQSSRLYGSSGPLQACHHHTATRGIFRIRLGAYRLNDECDGNSSYLSFLHQIQAIFWTYSFWIVHKRLYRIREKLTNDSPLNGDMWTCQEFPIFCITVLMVSLFTL